MISMFANKELYKPYVLIPVSSKSVEMEKLWAFKEFKMADIELPF